MRRPCTDQRLVASWLKQRAIPGNSNEATPKHFLREKVYRMLYQNRTILYTGRSLTPPFK